MTLKKPSELREMQPEERESRLRDLRSELMNERGVASMGRTTNLSWKDEGFEKAKCTINYYHERN